MSKLIKTIPCFVLCALFLSVSTLLATWLENGVPICTDQGLQACAMATSDGAGGAIIIWN